jgi:hypothetical protein
MTTRGLVALALGLVALAAWTAQGPPLMVTMAVTCALLAAASPYKTDLALSGLVVVLFTSAAVTDVVDLKFLPQVVDLASANTDPLPLLLQGDLWAPRYATVYPSVVLANELDVGLDEAFTAYGSALLALESLVLASAYRRATRRERRVSVWPGLAISLVVLAVATGMHGRLIPAHLGMSLILFAQMRSVAMRKTDFRTWLLTAVGIFLALMTTGTVIAAALQVLAGALLVQAPIAKASRGRITVALVTLALLFTPLIWQGIEKNIDFFSRGSAGIFGLLDALPGLLSHGAGEFLLVSPLAIPVVILIVLVTTRLVLPIYSKALRRGSPIGVLLISLPIAIVTGLFGYSTLTTGLPALEVIATLALAWVISRNRTSADPDMNSSPQLSG